MVVAVNEFASNGLGFKMAPHLADLTPDQGAFGTVLTLTGTDFGAAQNDSTLALNGQALGEINSWSDTEIIATLADRSTSGAIVLTVDGVASREAISFTVAPYIDDLTPTSAKVGQQITIDGLNFGAAGA